jgi:hypothetical protein
VIGWLIPDPRVSRLVWEVQLAVVAAVIVLPLLAAMEAVGWIRGRVSL